MLFLIHRKDLVVVKRESVASYESKKPSGQDAHLADKKLVVNDTARARRISQARFFVPWKNLDANDAIMIQRNNKMNLSKEKERKYDTNFSCGG